MKSKSNVQIDHYEMK